MDINGSNYWGSLPVVLEAIAKASYVAIDLEMTGVKTKDLSTSSKPTLEDVYDQAKRAAEKFQIVQFGLTCITYHKTAKEYRTENFNFSITPSVVGTAPIDGTLARIVDRYIGFSSSSMLFLKQNHFNMESAFKNGIPYLSKEEIELLKRKFLQPYGWVDPNHKVNLTDYDQEAIDFYNYALGLIHTWYDSKFREHHYVNIVNPHGGRLNTLQIRIISELVATQYPHCKASPRDDNWFMQVTLRDRVIEDQVAAKKLSERKDALFRQTGFRFVIEALAGGNFVNDMDVGYLIPETVPDRKAAIETMKKKLEFHQSKLSRETPIIIGHNFLYDLTYIYKSFYGDLPDTVIKFGRKIREIFPRVVDTKYLARRRGDHSMVADDTLRELFWSVRDQPVPKIMSDPMMTMERFTHQAGYDSWMTAFVFVKYAWTLAKKNAAEKASSTSTSAGHRPSPAQPMANQKFILPPSTQPPDAGSDPMMQPLLARFPAPPGPNYGTMPGRNLDWLFAQDGSPPRDQSASALLDGFSEHIPGWVPMTPTPSSSTSQLATSMGNLSVRDKSVADHPTAFEDGCIPVWNATFWREWGNRIRLGTAGTLDLEKLDSVVGPSK